MLAMSRNWHFSLLFNLGRSQRRNPLVHQSPASCRDLIDLHPPKQTNKQNDCPPKSKELPQFLISKKTCAGNVKKLTFFFANEGQSQWRNPLVRQSPASCKDHMDLYPSYHSSLHSMQNLTQSFDFGHQDLAVTSSTNYQSSSSSTTR